MARPGLPLRLTLQLWDKDETKHVRCTLRRPDGTQIAGSPAMLSHVDGGFYADASALFPFGVEFVCAFYEVFNDEELTERSDAHGEGFDTFYIEREEASDSSFITAVVGQVQLGMM